MNILMADLVAQYQLLRREIDEAVSSVLASGQFIMGPNVTAFEYEAAQYLGVRHAIGVASGTDSLILALRAAGIGKYDEVITTSFSFIATAEAIYSTGAFPVFVDVDENTFNIDVNKIETSINENTRAILVVHLFGQSADLDKILALCKKYDLLLIEDCAQSFGSDYRGRMTGSYGNFGCFSFYPSKNLGAYGDGGMIVTDNDSMAEKIRALRNHGAHEPGKHRFSGCNSRLDELQASILRVKLKYIDRFNEQRRKLAYYYNERLQSADLITPVECEWGKHVYHQYTIRSNQRELIQNNLAKSGIASTVFYSIPVHKQEVYIQQNRNLVLPVAENIANQVLSLPVYSELTMRQVDHVCNCILDTDKKGAEEITGVKAT